MPCTPSKTPSLFALADCNNFFASCERIFNPKLNGRPVIVLSNNDGCVVARSNEAKALGIGMGAPYFKCEEIIKRHRVHVYSANFVLYGDISNRVMSTLAGAVPQMEIYSIDEAFLYFEGFADPYAQALAIRRQVKRDVGMPVSIGVSLTKTLAKVANHIAKKKTVEGVFCMIEKQEIDHWLSQTPVEEIWGIGRQKAELLTRHGVVNALQLTRMPDGWIKDKLTVVSLKTVMELRGIPCLELEEVLPDKKAITTSRTFGREVKSLDGLEEAVSAYISLAAEKLRSQRSICGYLQVYVMTNRFKQGQFYANSAGCNLLPPTAYTPDLIRSAKLLVKKIYRAGYAYKKAGVILSHLKDGRGGQGFLFEESYPDSRKERLMKTVDAFNNRTNSGKIFLAAEGISQPWYMNQTHRSKRFTTRWDEMMEI